MQNYSELAEMVNSTNFAEMTYRELRETKDSFLWAANHRIDPLLETKRHNEMVALSSFYLDSISIFHATRSEIISCLDEAGMVEDHTFSSYKDEHDQTPTTNVENNQDKDECILALPEAKSSLGDYDKNDALESLDSDTPENDEAAPATNEQESDDTIPMSFGEQDFVGEALEALKALPVPSDIDVNSPYYVEGIFAYGDSETPGYSKPTWRNMVVKDLEAFRSSSEKYEKLFLKHDVLASTDDYLVVNESMNSLKVRLYHFPEEDCDGVDAISSNSDGSNNLSVDELKRRKRWTSLMKKAIKQAKELSLSTGEDANTPFYDRYKFSRDGKILNLCGDRVRVYEDADTLSELMPSFETYARLYRNGSLVVSKDNCVANVCCGTIYLVLFNIPSQKKKRGAKKKSEPTAKDNFVHEENPLIKKAVEMTKTLPVNKTTDKNAPYFLQCDFSVTGNGDLFPGRTFSRNVDSVDKFRTIHQKCASKFNSSQVSFTDEYTAYMWSGDKTISVFYYNAKDKAEAVA